MKLITTTMNYAGEFEVNVVSMFLENRFEVLKNKIDFHKISTTNRRDFYFGPNVSFNLSISDFMKILSESKDISDEEAEIFNKYGILELKGNFDVFTILENHVDNVIKNKRY